MDNKEESIDSVGAGLISNIVTNSINLVTKDSDIIDMPISNITLDAEIKSGGLVTVNVRVGYKKRHDQND